MHYEYGWRQKEFALSYLALFFDLFDIEETKEHNLEHKLYEGKLERVIQKSYLLEFIIGFMEDAICKGMYLSQHQHSMKRH